LADIGNDLFHRHLAFQQERTEPWLANAKLCGPISYAHRSPIVGNEMAVPLIACLFLFGSPPAVLWRVPGVVVDALNRMLGGRARPHIGVEFIKLTPSRTNGNSAPAVMPVGFVPSVLASLLHVMPDHVFGAAPKPVGCASGDCRLFSQAAARLRVAGKKIAARCLYFSAAFTDAHPYRPATARDVCPSREAAKLLAGQIFSFSHSASLGLAVYSSQGE
jgi:hypothetical protein